MKDMKEVASRCSICADHRWAVENMYLSQGSEAAKSLCAELGISQSAFYRHVKSHLSLEPSLSPSGQSCIEWCRAVANLAAAMERYRVIVDPAKIVDISICVGVDDVGQYVGVFITHSGALDEDAVMSMCINLGLSSDDSVLVPGISPTRMTAMRLHAATVFVGRMERKED